jgi:hypothetical protein
LDEPVHKTATPPCPIDVLILLSPPKRIETLLETELKGLVAEVPTSAPWRAIVTWEFVILTEFALVVPVIERKVV